jgi:hypothetical protein
MTMLWIAAIVLSASPGDAVNPSKDVVPPPAVTVEKPLVPPRAGRELETVVHAALRRWAKPSDKEANAAAREFIVLYKELQQDTRLPYSDREQLRGKVRGRLSQLAQQIYKRIERDSQQAGAGPKSVDIAKTRSLLAQRGGGGMNGGGVNQGGMNGGMFGGGGGNGMFGAEADNGQDLVDLIQATIAPTTWDVNGGPGSIYYWRQQHALVVHADQEVHEQLGGLLEQLNRASH